MDAFEHAFSSGDVSPAKARRASVASRHFDLKALMDDVAPPELEPDLVGGPKKK